MVRFISTLGSRTTAHASILIVTDADEGRALVEPLQLAGYETRCAPAARIDRMLEAERPDLAILDGPEAIRSCAAIKRAHGVQLPVVVIGDPRARVDAMRAGADHCASHPVPLEELLARIRALVEASAHCRVLASKVDTVRLWHDWVRYLIHDLRNPLAVAMAYVSIARATAEGDLAETLAPAAKGLDDTAAMLQDILDTDRIKHGALVPRTDQIDLAELARTVAADAAPGGAIEVEASGDTRLAADGALMKRVLGNLVVNATRHARVRAVQIGVTGGAHGVSVTVMNDGPAVDDELRPHLFEPWHPVHELRAGTGIGLAFCRLVCEAHGGRIWLENAAEGMVTFAFGIPRPGAPA